MDLFCGRSGTTKGVLLSVPPELLESGDTKGPDVEGRFFKAKEFDCPKAGGTDVPGLKPLANKFSAGAVPDPVLLENRFVEGTVTDAL